MSIWKTKISIEDLNQRSIGSLSDLMGIVYTKIGPDSLQAIMPVTEKSLQPMGILHGGASAVLAESVGSSAGNFCVDMEKFLCVGLDLNINHIRPVKSGILQGIAKPFHLGQKTQVWEIRLLNKEKDLVAISRLTLAIIKKKLF